MSSDKQRQKISFKFFLHKTTTKTFKPEQAWLRSYSMLAVKCYLATISTNFKNMNQVSPRNKCQHQLCGFGHGHGGKAQNLQEMSWI